MNRALVLSLLVLCFRFSFTLFGDEPGIVIVLYGTPCAGKSTLAFELQRILPGGYEIIKKNQLVDVRRIALIKEATGMVVEGREDIAKELINLPPQYKLKSSEIVNNALAETIDKVNALTDHGKNIILDICLDDPQRLEGLKGKKVIKVLVYGSLPILAARGKERKEKKKQSDFFEQKRLALIVRMFSRLYQPVSMDSPGAIDVLHKKELEVLCKECGEESNDSYVAIYKNKIEEYVENVIKLFHLETRESVHITPVKKPDLVVISCNHNTNDCECVRLITDQLFQRSEF